MDTDRDKMVRAWLAEHLRAPDKPFVWYRDSATWIWIIGGFVWLWALLSRYRPG